MPRIEGTILGGLPIIADVSFGRDGYTGEYWAEVDKIYWRKRDGTAGKEVSQVVRDRAERIDSSFCDLIEQANEFLAGPPVDEEPIQLTTEENEHAQK